MNTITILGPSGDHLVRYDLDAGTSVDLTLDGSTIIGEVRQMTETDRRLVDPEYLAKQVASLTDAVNQLILDALMGGM